MQNLSFENDFNLNLNELVSKTDLHMKGFALGLVLKQRQREPRKRPIVLILSLLIPSIMDCTKM